MKILFVDTTTDGTLIGGGHLILPPLMQALKERGHDVHLVTKGASNKRLQKLIDKSGVTVHQAPWSKKAPVEIVAPLFARWIEDMKFDAYVISTSAAIGWLALPYIPEHISTFMIGHNNVETYYYPVRHYHQFLSAAIGVSSAITDEYVSSCFMSKGRVAFIPYGVTTASEIRLDDDRGPLKIIYVGRVEQEQKRISDLINIVRKLSKSNVDYQLNIVGDGPEMENLKFSLSAELANGRVKLSGWLEKDDVIDLLRKADVFILTSAYEGFSIALTEAMANGCCPVVTNIKAGNQQLIRHGQNGFLIEVGDIEEFAKTLISLHSYIGLDLNQLRNAAWETGKAYSIAKMAENYESLFASVIANPAIYKRYPDTSYPIMKASMSKYPMWLRKIKSLLSSGQNV